METIWDIFRSNSAYTDLEYQLRHRIYKNSYVVTDEDLAWYCNEMKRLKMDNNFLVCGQNGVGKSYTGKNIAEECRTYDYKKTIDVFRNASGFEVARDICNHENTPFVIDEVSKYLHYMGSQKREQKALIDAIEVSRENKNVVIACTRDPRKVNLAFRDGKVHTVIYLLERGQNSPPWGVVLHAFSFIEQDDKWGFEGMVNARTPKKILQYAQDNDIFLGYYVAQPPTFDTKDYEVNKHKAIKHLGKEFQKMLDDEKRGGAGLINVEELMDRIKFAKKY